MAGHAPPLTPKVFHILLALAAEPLNGYQLALAVEESSDGAIRLAPGTLYENLHKLADRGAIRETDNQSGHETNGRGQRYYTITKSGLGLLRGEVKRLARDVRLARSIPAIGT